MCEHIGSMINAVTKGLTQNPAVIKAAPPVTRSRASVLWLALLVLYFLLLPTAADTPSAGVDLSPAGKPPAAGAAYPVRSISAPRP